MKFLVYKIINTENNKIYIGKTKEYYKDKILIIGYRVDILKNNIKIVKSFQSKSENLEELLNKAIEFKNQILNA